MNPFDSDHRLLSRRSVLGGLAASFAALTVSPKLALAAKTAGKPTVAEHLVVLWMNGGASHIDTWDPKPGAATGGPFKAIATTAKDVKISEHLPRVARHGRDLAFVRGMTTKEGNHPRGKYLLHTGYSPNPTVVHPALGSYFVEEGEKRESDLPPFVSLAGPSVAAGFLGVQYGPFIVQKPGKAPDNTLVPPSVNEAREERRLGLLDAIETDFAKETGDAKVEGRHEVYAQAKRMMKSPHLKAFDVSDEPDAVKKAYGDTDFGRGCLVARRLLESGTKSIEVTLDGWDTHQDAFNRETKLMEALDAGFSALLDDLAKRHLLEKTLVVCMSEFGRTPKINANEGRDHYPQAWSVVLGGCGVRTGIAHGETDAEGAKVTKDPTTVPDLMATMATVLGLDPDKSFATPSGRPISITENGKPIAALLKALSGNRIHASAHAPATLAALAAPKPHCTARGNAEPRSRCAAPASTPITRPARNPNPCARKSVCGLAPSIPRSTSPPRIAPACASRPSRFAWCSTACVAASTPTAAKTAVDAPRLA